MFNNSCRCCLTNIRLLVPLTINSNYNDNKTLLEYLNNVLGFPVKDLDNSNFICLRCSKALQVTYHFLKLVMESEQTIRNYSRTEETNLMGNSKVNVMENNKIENSYIVIAESKSNFEITHTNNTINFGNQLKIQVNKMNQYYNRPITKTRDLKLNNIKPKPIKGPTIIQQENIFKCEMCQKLFLNKDLLKLHNEEIHKGILPFKCNMCNFYSCYSESLLKHYKKDHGILDNVELKLYQTKEPHTIVTEKPHFELTYKCFKCDFETLSQSIIDEHLLNEHSINDDKDWFTIKFYSCPACHRLFNDRRSISIHYTMFHCSASQKIKMFGKKKYSCNKCGNFFDLKSALFLHKRLCEPRDPVKCNFCDLQFSSVIKYEQHLQTKHSVAVKHECEICGKSFNCSEFLTVHRKRHNERYYQCDLCPKNYINNAELKVHKQRIHSRNNRFRCTLCGKTFSHLSLLRNHEANEHLKEYIKCAYCEFKSHSKYAIKAHQYKHTGKPYKCKLCFKEFVLRKDIKQHCQSDHSLVISDKELEEMFKKTNGYTSRFDAFSNQNNNLHIDEINELDLDGELKEFGLTLQDIMDDLLKS